MTEYPEHEPRYPKLEAKADCGGECPDGDGGRARRARHQNGLSQGPVEGDFIALSH